MLSELQVEELIEGLSGYILMSAMSRTGSTVTTERLAELVQEEAKAIMDRLTDVCINNLSEVLRRTDAKLKSEAN